MTALEEIKKALAAAEQFIVNGVELGYIRMPAPQTPDSAHDTLPMIRRAQTALESLQRENEEMKSELAHEASHRQKLQNALAYWMPGVTEEIEISTNGRCGDDALLLVGSEGPFEDKCWGNQAIARAEAAEAEVKRLQAEIDRKSSMPGDHRYWEGRYRDEAAENEKLREALTGLVSCHDDFNASSGNMEEAYYKLAKYAYPKWEAARASLASTGGEHNAE